MRFIEQTKTDNSITILDTPGGMLHRVNKMILKPVLNRNPFHKQSGSKHIPREKKRTHGCGRVTQIV